MKRFVLRLLTPLFRLLPLGVMRRVIMALTALTARSRGGTAGARFVFDLEGRLYRLEQEMATAHGGGLHPKHRLIGYHDFFCERIRPGERVIDIGSGVGALAHSIATRCEADVVGVELDGRNVAMANERHSHPRLNHIHGDVLTDLPGETFDVAVMSNVLEHIEDRVGFLRQVQAAQRPRRWLIRVPMFDRDWRVPLKKELGVEWRLDVTHFIEYTLPTFHEEMAAAGLRPTHVEVRWGEIWAELEPEGDGAER